MKIIPIILGSKTMPRELYIGFQGENEVTSFQFDFSSFINEFGRGYIGLVHSRPNDRNAYPCEFIIDGNKATWAIRQADTKYEGIGECQLTYIVNNEIKKTEIFKTKILRSLGTQGSVPQAYNAWVNQVLQAAADAIQARDEFLGTTATAEVDENVGIPNVVVTRTTVDGHYNFDFNFTNLKGEPGEVISDHSALDNRDLPNQHPIEAISGLSEELAAKANISDLSQVAFTGQMSDLLTTTPTILYCGTATEVVHC